jgi:Zn-dependent peptidase ImmA (M78 family)
LVIIREYGWKIFNFDFTGEDTDAGIIKMKNSKYAVFVDPYKKLLSPRRYRFTLAHEIGHVALGHYSTYDLNTLSPLEINILDKEADEFAGEFLVPKTMLKMVKIIDIDRLSDVFQVSHDVMRIRLQRHNMIKMYKALRY